MRVEAFPVVLWFTTILLTSTKWFLLAVESRAEQLFGLLKDY